MGRGGLGPRQLLFTWPSGKDDPSWQWMPFRSLRKPCEPETATWPLMHVRKDGLGIRHPVQSVVVHRDIAPVSGVSRDDLGSVDTSLDRVLLPGNGVFRKSAQKRTSVRHDHRQLPIGKPFFGSDFGVAPLCRAERSKQTCANHVSWKPACLLTQRTRLGEAQARQIRPRQPGLPKSVLQCSASLQADTERRPFQPLRPQVRLAAPSF